MTLAGLEEAKKELDQLKNVSRLEIAERIQRAREFGDLSENSEYDTAIQDQTFVENRIVELEAILKDTQLINNTTRGDLVVIGSTVKVDIDGKSGEFTIVGSVEADPSKKRISDESPLGSALLGAKVGDDVEVSTPQVKYRCKVVEIK